MVNTLHSLVQVSIQADNAYATDTLATQTTKSDGFVILLTVWSELWTDYVEENLPWAPATVWSRSASGQMMQGDLPPSSRVTGLIRSAACFMISLPTSVLPGSTS